MVFEGLVTDLDCLDEPILATQRKMHLKEVQFTGPLEFILKILVSVFTLNPIFLKGTINGNKGKNPRVCI